MKLTHEVRAEVPAATATALAEFLAVIPDQAIVKVGEPGSGFGKAQQLVATWEHQDADDAVHATTCQQHPAGRMFDVGQDIAARPDDYALKPHDDPGARDYNWTNEPKADPVQLEGTGQAEQPCDAYWNDRRCIRKQGHQHEAGRLSSHVYAAEATGGDLYPEWKREGVGLGWYARQQAASDAQYGRTADA